jgi:hypothetical protein
MNDAKVPDLAEQHRGGGANLAIASKCLGHSHADVIQSVDYNPDLEKMIEAVDHEVDRPLADRGAPDHRPSAKQALRRRNQSLALHQ